MSEISLIEKSEREPKIEIIEYSKEYQGAVQALVDDIQKNEFGRQSKSGRPDLQRIEKVYQTERGNFWIANENGELVGTLALKDMGLDRGELWRFYVKKDMRSKGVGGKLFSTLMDFARDRGYRELFLATHQNQEAANKFYLKHGFKRIEAMPDDFPATANEEIFYKIDLEEKK